MCDCGLMFFYFVVSLFRVGRLCSGSLIVDMIFVVFLLLFVGVLVYIVSGVFDLMMLFSVSFFFGCGRVFSVVSIVCLRECLWWLVIVMFFVYCFCGVSFFEVFCMNRYGVFVVVLMILCIVLM